MPRVTRGLRYMPLLLMTMAGSPVEHYSSSSAAPVLYSSDVLHARGWETPPRTCHFLMERLLETCQTLRGGGLIESSGKKSGVEEILCASSLDAVADYVTSTDNPVEVRDSDFDCETVPLPPQPQHQHQDTPVKACVLQMDIRPPPRSERKVSWQETNDLSVFENMLKDSPKNADLWSAYGHALWTGHNEASRAMQAYGRAIDLVPSHSFALNNLGYLLMKNRNDITMAEGCYRKALAVDPADINTNVNLAVLLSAHRHPPDFETAAACYERALSADNKHLGALVNYANFLVERPLPTLDKQAADAAAKAFGQAAAAGAGVRSPPAIHKNLPVLEDLRLRRRAEEEGGYTWEEYTRTRTPEEEEAAQSAITYMISKLQDWKKAEGLYQRALEVKPDSADALCGFASLKRHEDDVEGAEALYQTAISADPHHHETRLQYGLMLHKLNRLANAREQYERARALNPSEATSALFLASLLEMQRAPTAEIIAMYKHALLIEPASAEIYHNMGRALQASDIGASKLMFEFALEYEPRHINSLNSLALILQFQGQHVEAQMLLQKAIRLGPDECGLHCNYASLLQGVCKEQELAEQHYQAALALQPDHLQTLCCYGSFLHTVRRDYEEALRLLTRALELAPDMPEVRKCVALVKEESRPRTGCRAAP